MRKPAFCINQDKATDQLCGYRPADLRLFLIHVVQSPDFQNPKFQASNHPL